MSNSHGGRISDHMYPFYRVFDEKGEQYCDCSHEEYAIRTVDGCMKSVRMKNLLIEE